MTQAVIALSITVLLCLTLVAYLIIRLIMVTNAIEVLRKEQLTELREVLGLMGKVNQVFASVSERQAQANEEMRQIQTSSAGEIKTIIQEAMESINGHIYGLYAKIEKRENGK